MSVQQTSFYHRQGSKVCLHRLRYPLQDMEGRAIDMRAEVGCLTRNVLIQGDSDSPVDQYGAHIMLHSPPAGDLATTTGRISHIECYRCGQVRLLGS